VTLSQKIKFLKERGVVMTIQRYGVLEYLYNHRTHPTAEEIYQGLKNAFPAISRATVYNTLELLKEHRLIQEVVVEKDRARYDYRTDPHLHFLCRRCSRVYDLEISPSCPFSPGDEVEGHRVEELKPYIIGVCRRCLEEEKDARAT